MRNLFITALCICNIVLFAGCDGIQKKETPKPVVSEKKAARDANSPVKLKEENARLKQQVETLMGLDKQVRTAALSTLNGIEITNRSGLYPNQETKKKDRLVVYLKPIDDMGDVVKAAGEVQVELWNLNAKPENAMLGQWKLSPEELKKKWVSSLMSTQYKLEFDVAPMLKGNEKELTVKVQFTDYLTGKIFKGQAVINKN